MTSPLIPLTPTTELQAVNLMLRAIGETPVSSLEVSGLVDVATAKEMLGVWVRNTLKKGWNFNTDDDYSLAQDGDGKVPVPAAALSVDPSDTYKDYTQRGDPPFLYDRTNQTLVINASVKCDIIWSFPFNELPEAARWYISVGAARQFQTAMMGDAEQDYFADSVEQDAWADLLKHHSRSADINMNNDPAMYAITRAHRRSVTRGLY